MSACMFGVGLNALWTAGSADGVTSEKQADKERRDRQECDTAVRCVSVDAVYHLMHTV